MGVSFGCFSLEIWLLALFSEPLVRTDACVLGLACKQGALGVGMDIRTLGNRSHELGCIWEIDCGLTISCASFVLLVFMEV